MILAAMVLSGILMKGLIATTSMILFFGGCVQLWEEDAPFAWVVLAAFWLGYLCRAMGWFE